jgi:hypothetical protein
MRNIKNFKLFEEVSITPSKKSELMPLVKKKLQLKVDDLIGYDYTKQGVSYSTSVDMRSLIKVAEENTDLDLKKVLDDLNKKIVNSQIPEWTYKSITTGTEPIESFEFIVKTLEETIKKIISNISWPKRKIIGVAMRVKHPTKSSFIKNLKDPRLKDAEESDYKFHFYRYRGAIESLLICGASAFISKEDYFISSDKKDKSRQNYNKFYDSIDAPAFQKKIEASFDKILNTVWDSI